MSEAEGSEPEFVQNVTAVAGFAYGVIGADIHIFGNGLPLYLMANWRSVPTADPEWLRELPSRMLNARRAVVPFTGRERELADLRQWRDAGTRLAVRWMHGPGGQGKTRLADQFATESAVAGWKVVAASHGADADRPEPGSQDLRLQGATGLLVVVDYADRWLLTNLTWLFKNALLHQTGVVTRVLMLARTTDAWPSIRGILDAYQASTSSQPLSALAEDSDERAGMFATALDSFAGVYQLPDASGILPPGPLDEPEFALTLTVHMAALVAVDARAANRRPPAGAAGLTVYLLDREQLHWARLYENGPVSGRCGDGYQTPPEVMNQAVFAAAITGTVAPTVGVGLMEGLQLPSPDRIVRDHAFCYPAPDGGNAVLEPLYPDRLAEDFLALTFPGHDADYPAQAWAVSAAEALLEPRADAGEPAAWTPRGVTFLASAAHRWPHVSQNFLFPLLLGDPGLAMEAGSAALIAIAELPDVDLAVLEAIESRFPVQRHVDLDTGIAAVAQRLATYRLSVTTEQETLAAIHNDLGIRLYYAGRYELAVDSGRNAVKASRQLTGASPPSHVRGLAKALTNLGIWLPFLGLREEALAATQEAVSIRRHLAQANPAAYERDLARSLNSLANRLSELGQTQEALAAADEATQLTRKLVP